MRVEFVKMHGLGNDFVVLDARTAPLALPGPAAVRALADRHQGIGCDQLIVLEPSTQGDFAMRIFNADGGEVEACGNATRAIGLMHGRAATIETRGGMLTALPTEGGVRVILDAPRFAWNAIPLAYPLDTLHLPLAWEDLADPAAVNVGNPHIVFFVADGDAVPLERLGPLIEHDPVFPERVNVNVATIETRDRLRLRVWERGAGLTRACGTGACASAIAAMRRRLVERTVTVALPGGELLIEWGEDGAIAMTGPASESFRGSFESADYGWTP